MPLALPEPAPRPDFPAPSSAPFPPSLRFIDLFAGIGGFRLAFENAGAECVFASEWDDYAAKTYAANFGPVPDGDVTKIETDAVPDHDVCLLVAVLDNASPRA